MRFEYRGQSPSGVTAEVVSAELQRIHTEQGAITPSAVVESARPEDAPLHHAFEWDDSTAAEEYRKVQARQIVRAVIVVPEPERGETFQPVRAFVSVNMENGRTYRPILAALREPDEREQVLRRFRNELMGIRQRYLNLIEFAELTGQFAEIERRLTRVG